MMNEAEAYFALYGSDFDPGEVTHLDVDPISIKRKAEPWPKHSSRKVSSGCIESDIVDGFAVPAATHLARWAPRT